MRILITGGRHVGKSTLVRRLFENLAIQPVGLKTFPFTQNERTVGYFLQNLQTGEKRVFAHVNFKGDIRFGNFGVRSEVFEEFGVAALNELLVPGGWILVDEIGLMEMHCTEFIRAALKVWASPRNQLWVVQKRSPILHLLAASDVSFVRFTVTLQNRSELMEELTSFIYG